MAVWQRRPALPGATGVPALRMLSEVLRFGEEKVEFSSLGMSSLSSQSLRIDATQLPASPFPSSLLDTGAWASQPGAHGCAFRFRRQDSARAMSQGRENPGSL